MGNFHTDYALDAVLDAQSKNESVPWTALAGLERDVMTYVVLLGEEDGSTAPTFFMAVIPPGMFLMVHGSVFHCGMACSAFHVRSHFYCIPKTFGNHASFDEKGRPMWHGTACTLADQCSDGEERVLKCLIGL